MTRNQRIPLPSGLPKRFLDGRPGFQRLQEFLEIPHTKDVRALLDAVKNAVPSMPRKLPSAERRGMGLTAYYENPESRRGLWRQALGVGPRLPARGRGRPVPSLEFIALQSYDAEFREREVDTAAIEDALRDLPDVVDSVADAPDWQRPALAAWPALHRDVSAWSDLPEDRHEATSLAVFAVATVLDDVRLLQRAARCVDTLADEFAMLLSDRPEIPPTEGEDPRTEEEDVIRRWRKACDAIAATARALAADPLQPELLPEHLSELSRHVNTLTDLRAPVTDALNRSAPERLLERVDVTVARLAEDGDSPTAPWTDQIAAQWRSAYPRPADFDVETLRTDVERLEAELPDVLAAWRTAKHRRAEVERRHHEARQSAEYESDPLKRLSAENQEAELQQQLARAAHEIRTARDDVFKMVAPGDQVFDPHRHRADEGAATSEPQEPPEPAPRTTVETIAGDEAQTDEAETDEAEVDEAETDEAEADEAEADEADDSAAGDPAPPTDPTQTAEPPVPPEPPLADRRETSAVHGLWHALRSGRPGIAYHIARLCAEHGYITVAPTLADVIAASLLAPHVHSPDSESARNLRPILERIDPSALLRNERRQSERDALSLLLFSATLRPALFAPTTGAPSLLRGVSLSDGLQPAYDLASRVADHADRLLGVRLHVSMFRSTQTGTWQEQFDALAGRVRVWHAGADSKRNIYGPATKVWRDLFGRDGLLAKLVRLISDSDKSVRLDVEAIHEQISDQRTFHQLVHRADQRGPKRNPIEGRALKQIWNDVQPAVHLSGQWLSLMDTRPDTAGFIARRIEALHNDLERDGRRAIQALAKAVDSRPSATPLAATSTLACNTIKEVLQLFDSDAEITESGLDVNVLRSRDLLYVTDVDTDASFNPVSTDETRLLDRLLDTSSHANTMGDAFDARLERHDFLGARLALDFIEGEEDLDACITSLGKRIDDRRRALRTDLQSTQKRLESAFCRGQLPADDRDEMAAKLTALRQVAQPSSAAPSLHDVEILTGSSRRLIEVDDAIQACGHKSIDAVRGRLRNVPPDRMDEAARAIVDRTIEQGYVQTAHEQINLLEDGKSVEPPPPSEDPFSAFTSAVEAIETALKSTNPQTIVHCAAAREPVAAAPFNELAEEDAQSAASLLDAWYQTARKRSVDETRLRDLLTGLGFSVRKVNPLRSGSQATVTTQPIADRAVCPSRQFGSEANGRYRVLLNRDRSAIDSIFRSIGIESGDPTIVLHFGCLGADRDKIRKRATREHRLFLVVDETLVLFRVRLFCVDGPERGPMGSATSMARAT